MTTIYNVPKEEEGNLSKKCAKTWELQNITERYMVHLSK